MLFFLLLSDIYWYRPVSIMKSVHHCGQCGARLVSSDVQFVDHTKIFEVKELTPDN